MTSILYKPKQTTIFYIHWNVRDGSLFPLHHILYWCLSFSPGQLLSKILYRSKFKGFFNYNTRILTITKKIHFILRKSCKTCNQIKWSNTYVIEKTQTYWQKLQDKAAYEYKRCNRNSREHMILVNKYVKILLYPD